jgi:hypothetical protein
VDQAWHLHLVYTDSYWNHLCGKILKCPLHHGPTKGGKAEGGKHRNWYAETLSSYRQLFVTEPPADIWPKEKIRFGQAPIFRRVNLKQPWLLPKPSQWLPKGPLKIQTYAPISQHPLSGS